MSKNKNLQDILLSKSIYINFLDLVNDSDDQTRKDAIKCVVEAARYHPSVLINIVLQRLNVSAPVYSQEYFCSYVKLLIEFFKTCPGEISEDDLRGIYSFLKMTIMHFQATIRASRTQNGNNIYKMSQETIFSMIQELSKIDPKRHLEFILSFINPQNVPDSFILTLLFQLKEASPKIIPEHLLDVLEKLISTLPSAKGDDNKLQMANLFVDILEASANYQDELASSLDLTLLNKYIGEIRNTIDKDWLQSRNSKLRTLSLYLIGVVVALLPTKEYLNDTDAESTAKLFINYLSKESKEDHPKILKALRLVVERYSKLTDKSSMKVLVANVLLALQPMLITPIFSKNYKFGNQQSEYKDELMGIVSILGEYFPNQLFDYFIQKVGATNNNKLEIIASLWIMTDIIRNFHAKLREHLKKVFLAHVQSIIEDTNHEVQYVILESALLVVKTGFPKIEDAKFLLDFLMAQLIKTEEESKIQENVKIEGFETTIETVKTKAHEVFSQISNDKNGAAFLWPKILNYLMLPAFSPELSFILENLRTIITSETYDELLFRLNSSAQNNIVQPQRLLLRCLILCFVPNAFPKLGYQILNVFPILVQVFTKGVSTPSTKELIELLSNQQESSLKPYFEKLEEFSFDFLGQITKLECCQNFKEAVIEAFSIYANNHELLGAVCIIYGMILNQLDKNSEVLLGLEKLFNICHSGFSKNTGNESLNPIVNKTLRENISKAIGIVSMNHFDVVSDFVNQTYFNLEKNGLKKQSILMSLFTVSKDDGFKEDMLLTIIQILGYISYYAKPEQFIKKFDSIVSLILENLDRTRYRDLKFACARTLREASHALFRASQKKEISTPRFKEDIVEKREKILSRLIKVQSDEKIQELHVQIYISQAYLSRIEPPLGEKFYFSLIKELLSLFPTTYTDTYANFAEPFGEIVYTIVWKNEIRSISEGTLQILTFWDALYQLLFEEKQYLAKLEDEDYRNKLRKIFIQSLLNSLKNKEVPDPTSKDNTLFIKSLVEILGYTMVNNEEIKHLAIACVLKLLKEGDKSYDQAETENFGLFLLNYLKKKYDTQTSVPIFIKLLAEKKNSKELAIYIGFNNLFRVVYEENHSFMKEDLKSLLSGFFEILDQNTQGESQRVQSNMIQEETMATLACMMNCHLQEIIDIMLKRKPEFPLASSISAFLHRIAQHKNLLASTFNYLTDIIHNPEQNLVVPSSEANATLFNATIFFGVVMEAKHELVICLARKFFSQILGTFLLRLTTCFDYLDSTSSMLEKGSFQFTLWSFQMFLRCIEEKAILSYIEGIKSKRESLADIEEVICELIMIVCKNSQWHQIKTLVEFLLPFLNKTSVSQRCLVVIVISQAIYSSIFVKEFSQSETNFFEDFKLFENWIHELLQILLLHLESDVEMIRKYCLRGLGSMFYLLNLKENPKLVEHNIDTENLWILDESSSISILNFLIKGIEDQSILCIREALGSFLRMLTLLDHNHLGNQLETICTRLKVLFESDDAQIRMGALNLIGKLFSTLNHKGTKEKEKLNREIHNCFVQILVHMLDDSGAARQACIMSLHEVSELLELPELSCVLDESQDNDSNHELLDHDEKILVGVAKVLCSKFWGRVSTYFYTALDMCENQKEYIRAAAIFFLLALLDLIDVTRLSLEDRDIETTLLKCLSDPSQKVKRKAAKGFSLLSDLHRELNIGLFQENNTRLEQSGL